MHKVANGKWEKWANGKKPKAHGFDNLSLRTGTI